MRIEFRDIGGAACNSPGVYEYNVNDDKLNFTLIKIIAMAEAQDCPASGIK